MSTTVVSNVVTGLTKDQIKGLRKGQKLFLNYNATDHSFTAEVVFNRMEKDDDVCCLVKIAKIIDQIGKYTFFVGDPVLVRFNELTLL